jgi:hypothetical protein
MEKSTHNQFLHLHQIQIFHHQINPVIPTIFKATATMKQKSSMAKNNKKIIWTSLNKIIN